MNRILTVLVLGFPAACATNGKAAPPAANSEAVVGETPAPSAADRGLEREFERAQLEREHADTLYRVHLKRAYAYRKRNEMHKARRAAELALSLKPRDKEALDLHAEIETALGLRTGSLEVEMGNVIAHERAKTEERELTARRIHARARKELAVNDYEAARRSYVDALFVVDTAQPKTDALTRLGNELRRELAAVRRLEKEHNKAEAERIRQETLEKIKEQGG